jgi:hypothetical protein
MSVKGKERREGGEGGREERRRLLLRKRVNPRGIKDHGREQLEQQVGSFRAYKGVARCSKREERAKESSLRESDSFSAV